MPPYSIKSFAKINLGLKVLNKRLDEFHNIDSIFIEINLYDKISFFKSSCFELKYKNSDSPINKSDNTITQAYELLSKKYKFKNHYKIILDKRIPLSSGLGGGSSNAAYTMKALNHLNKLKINNQDLLDLALSIGSDVPFFINGGIKHVTGRGDKIKPCTININKKLLFLLVFPHFSISTKMAFKNIKKYLEPNFKRPKFASLTDNVNWKLFNNDFENFVAVTYPEILDIKSTMYKNGALYSGLSGSGSTMFGVYNKNQFLLQTKKKLKLYKTYIASPV